MGLFTPLVESDFEENNFDWILELLRELPKKEEYEKLLLEIAIASRRAEDLLARIDSIMKSATEAAKTEIKNDNQNTIKEIQNLVEQVNNKTATITSVISNATENAKKELKAALSSDIIKAQTAAATAEQKAEEAANVVQNGVNVLQQNIVNELDSAKIALSNDFNTSLDYAKEEVEEAIHAEFEEVRSNINLKQAELDSHVKTATNNLNTAINNKIVEVRESIAQENTNAVNEVKSFILTNPFYHAISLNLLAANWVGNEQAVTALGVENDSHIIIAHAPDSYAQYVGNGVYCYEKASGLLRFRCESVPTENIVAQAFVFLGGVAP